MGIILCVWLKSQNFLCVAWVYQAPLDTSTFFGTYLNFLCHVKRGGRGSPLLAFVKQKKIISFGQNLSQRRLTCKATRQRCCGLLLVTTPIRCVLHDSIKARGGVLVIELLAALTTCCERRGLAFWEGCDFELGAFGWKLHCCFSLGLGERSCVEV